MIRRRNGGPHADPWLRSGIDGDQCTYDDKIGMHRSHCPIDHGAAAPEIRPKSLPKLLAQGKHWRRSDGTWVRVKDMHPAHRANAAAMLLRSAAEYAQKVSMAELKWSFGAPEEVEAALEQKDRERTSDPEKWMRSTKLYRRLTKGLPVVPVHRGGCQVCDERRASGELIPTGPDTGLLADVPDVPKLAAADVDAWGTDGAAARVALQTVLTVLNEWIEGAVRDCEGAGHGRPWAHDDGLPCGERFGVKDIRSMVAEAARRIGVTL